MAANAVDEIASPSPKEVSFPLPRAPHTNIHLRLMDNGPNILVLITSKPADSISSTPLGSLVYAMPNRLSPSSPLSTPLFTQVSTLDFTTRLSKVLARKTGKPVYVGNSTSFASAGMGGAVEEEMEAFRRVVHVIMGLLEEER